ncbi:TPA: glucosamine-6-phosphate isomerase, partial [Streptococcus suis]
EYYNFSKSELENHSRIPLIIKKNNEEIFISLALEMVELIKENNKKNEKTVIICPVGPVGHYPHFVRLVNQFKIDLSDVWFINMDEYLSEDLHWIDVVHPLSFRGFMQKTVYSQIHPTLIMPEEQRIFPDPLDIDLISNKIKELGKIDLCIGGIGLNGHIAFNEPDSTLTVQEFLKLESRVLPISVETKVMNCLTELKGAVEEVPNYCVTIGMSEIFQAKKIRLAVFRDWHHAVIRKTVCSKPDTGFPSTLMQIHTNCSIYLNESLAN